MTDNHTLVITTFNPSWQIDFPLKLTQAILITLFNGVVLIAFIRLNKYTFSNMLFINLCVSDIILGCLDLPLSLVGLLVPQWPLGDVVCVIYQIVANSQFSVSGFLLLVTSLHRFLQFIKPYDSQEKVTKRRLAIFACCWLLPTGV